MRAFSYVKRQIAVGFCLVFTQIGCVGPLSDLVGSDNEILSFVFRPEFNDGLEQNIAGVVGENTVSVILPGHVDETYLRPSITYSGESITPEPETPTDFSRPVTYIVTALNGETRNTLSHSQRRWTLRARYLLSSF